MNQFWNAVRGHAARVAGQLGGVRWGTVTSVDPVGYRVKIALQPEGTQTAWLPILSHGAGNGWSLLMLPQVGSQAAAIADSMNGAHLIVVGFAHSTVDVPPSVPNAIGTGGVPNTTAAPNVAGELIVRNQAGAVLRLCADGSIYLHGNLNVDGTIHANGDVFDRHGSLDRLRMNYNAHTHPDPQGGNTGITSNPDPE